ncbi:MAG: hypothetical protein AB2L24_34175 [Mangrovibacterium sp.]
MEKRAKSTELILTRFLFSYSTSEYPERGYQKMRLISLKLKP